MVNLIESFNDLLSSFYFSHIRDGFFWDNSFLLSWRYSWVMELILLFFWIFNHGAGHWEGAWFDSLWKLHWWSDSTLYIINVLSLLRLIHWLIYHNTLLSWNHCVWNSVCDLAWIVFLLVDLGLEGAFILALFIIQLISCLANLRPQEINLLRDYVKIIKLVTSLLHQILAFELHRILILHYLSKIKLHNFCFIFRMGVWLLWLVLILAFEHINPLIHFSVRFPHYSIKFFFGLIVSYVANLRSESAFFVFSYLLVVLDVAPSRADDGLSQSLYNWTRLHQPLIRILIISIRV